MWETDDSVQRAAAEVAANATVKGDSKRANRDREEADAWAKDEAVMKEKAEKTRKAREARAKCEADFVESAKTWANATTGERADIARLAYENRNKANFEASARNNPKIVNRATSEKKAKAEAETVERARAWAEEKAKEKEEIIRVNAEDM